MSSNKTSNYQLHLWEPQDDFLREEFNENSRRIEAGISDAAQRAAVLESQVERVPLGRYNVTEAVRELELDLSGFDFSPFYGLELQCVQLSTTTSGGVSVDAYVNNIRTSVYGSNTQGARSFMNVGYMGNGGYPAALMTARFYFGADMMSVISRSFYYGTSPSVKDEFSGTLPGSNLTGATMKSLVLSGNFHATGFLALYGLCRKGVLA